MLPAPLRWKKWDLAAGCDCHTAAALLAREDEGLWLESGASGRRVLMLGCHWRLQGGPGSWYLHRPGQVSQAIPEPRFTSFDLLNWLELWLNQAGESQQLGVFLAYESAWQVEERRGSSAQRCCPDTIILAPQALLICEADGSCHFWGEKPMPEVVPALSRTGWSAECTLKLGQSEASYLESARRVQEEIRKGNSFQVNLSQPLLVSGKVDPLSWALDLLTAEAGPFSMCWRHPDFHIISQSPERLVRKEKGGRLITRPIAGTLARGFADDEALRVAAFRGHFKELAEHNMLIDLERNDLGKVSRPGTVEVSEHLCLESYAHLYHLVSEVCGNTEAETGCGDVARALFPGGTITGCPKLETMHIIDRLEVGPREAYTGSAGWMASGGEMDLNILIRTALLTDDGACLRVGGGIVWDSEPQKEYQETLTKARGLCLSLLRGGAKIDPDHRPLRQFFL